MSAKRFAPLLVALVVVAVSAALAAGQPMSHAARLANLAAGNDVEAARWFQHVADRGFEHVYSPIPYVRRTATSTESASPSSMRTAYPSMAACPASSTAWTVSSAHALRFVT